MDSYVLFSPVRSRTPILFQINQLKLLHSENETETLVWNVQPFYSLPPLYQHHTTTTTPNNLIRETSPLLLYNIVLHCNFFWREGERQIIYRKCIFFLLDKLNKLTSLLTWWWSWPSIKHILLGFFLSGWIIKSQSF